MVLAIAHTPPCSRNALQTYEHVAPVAPPRPPRSQQQQRRNSATQGDAASSQEQASSALPPPPPPAPDAAPSVSASPTAPAMTMMLQRQVADLKAQLQRAVATNAQASAAVQAARKETAQEAQRCSTLEQQLYHMQQAAARAHSDAADTHSNGTTTVLLLPPPLRTGSFC